MIKDILVLVGVVFAGIVLPIRFFGSPATVITRVLEQQPHWMTLHGTTTADGTVWFVTTVLLTAMGFFMFPQTMAAIYAARSQDTLRRNAVFLPFYQVMILLMYFGGFTALLLVPGLKGTEGDQSFMLVVQKYYSPWVVGFIAGAGCLAALIPASAQILGASSIVSKNLLIDYGIVKSQAGLVTATRILVLLVAALAFSFWFFARQTLVGLLLISYTGITQFFPGVALSFSQRLRPNAAGVGAGIAVGILTLIISSARKTGTLAGINNGMLALMLNVIALFAVSALTRGYSRPKKQNESRLRNVSSD